MLTEAETNSIRLLSKRGLSLSEISRTTRKSYKTVRKYAKYAKQPDSTNDVAVKSPVETVVSKNPYVRMPAKYQVQEHWIGLIGRVLDFVEVKYGNK